MKNAMFFVSGICEIHEIDRNVTERKLRLWYFSQSLEKMKPWVKQSSENLHTTNKEKTSVNSSICNYKLSVS